MMRWASEVLRQNVKIPLEFQSQVTDDVAVWMAPPSESRTEPSELKPRRTKCRQPQQTVDLDVVVADAAQSLLRQS